MPWNTPSSAPAKPAMAAEITNTPSLVTIGFTPSVAHAAGLSPSAVSRRPNALLCSNTTSTPTTPSATAMKSIVPTSWSKSMPRNVNGLLKSKPEDVQRLDRLAVEPEDLGLREEQDRRHLREGHRREREVQALQAERGQRHRDTERDREQRRDREAADGAEGGRPLQERERAGADEGDLRQRDLLRPAGERDERHHDEHGEQRERERAHVGALEHEPEDGAR